ncbi:MAG TPA: Asp-tRNA(Asn)/Glu-tRNA(Gln) amidotransferase subunit GatA [Candidatus Gracilibacteria bacterium]
MNPTSLSLFELSKKLGQKEISSRELTDSYIKNIEAREGDINAFITKTFDLAREMADASDSRRAAGKTYSNLDGIPLTVKDLVCTEGIQTTGGSQILKGFVPPYDATVWGNLKKAGAVLLGKTNCDQFGMGSSTENSGYGNTKNPLDLKCVPGGSSGGSAAAIAADFCAGSVGTDTGGSVRQPAHFCGITGLKVSYGRVSRYGVTAYASSLDTIGPMGKTAQDCAMLLQVMAGHDDRDSTTPNIEVPDYLNELEKDLPGFTIGIPEEYLGEGISQSTLQALESTKAVFKDLGVTFKTISLPHTKYAVPAYYIIAPCEVSANMARYDGIRFGNTQEGANYEEIIVNTRTHGFGDEVKRRILLGTYALSAGYYDAYYRKAQKVRTLICQDFTQAFEGVDAILAPTAPTAAFEIGKNTADPLQMYLEDILTIPASLAGITGITFPVGQSQEGLPIGMQLLGPAFKEERVLRMAHQFQTAIDT